MQKMIDGLAITTQRMINKKAPYLGRFFISMANQRLPIERRVPRGGIQVRSAYCSGFGRT